MLLFVKNYLHGSGQDHAASAESGCNRRIGARARILLRGRMDQRPAPAAGAPPYDQGEIARVAYATAADLERATEAAVAAFEKTRHLASYERQQILQRVLKAIAERKEEL